MRSVIDEDQQRSECGICKSKEPFIEYKNLYGVDFILCHKCHTITFKNNPPLEIIQLIENKMNHLTTKKVP